MDTRLLPLFVAGLVLLAGCAGPLQTGTSDESSGPTISVTGTGEVTTESDLAVVSLSVVSTADTAAAARDDTAARVEALREAMADAGFEDVLESTGFTLRVDRDRNGSPEAFVATHSFRVEVSPDDAGTVVDVAIDASETRVDGVRFTVTDETRAELRERALDRAVGDARVDADALAAALDLEVTGVVSASSGGDFVPFREAAFDERAGGAATSFTPGPVTVTATVSVTYTAA